MSKIPISEDNRLRQLDAEKAQLSADGSDADLEASRDSKSEAYVLGEGPIAGAEVEYAVQAELKGDNEDVSPGMKGWLCVVGACMVNMICYGMTNSFGVFQEHYSTHQLSTSSATAISWIGSIQMCLCPLLGCVSGPLFDAGYLKSLVAVGGGIYVFCLMMTSIATEYYQFLLAHGIGVGIGMGLVFSPSVSTLSHHFAKSKYRTIAYGCQAAGSSLAGVIFPIMLRYLFPAVGFGWGMRILGFVVLLWTTCAFFFLSRTHPPRKIEVLSPRVFKNPMYTIFVAGIGCVSLAIYCPLTFGVTYATANGFDSASANYALAISNGASFFGRVVPLVAAQRLGVMNVNIAFSITSCIMLFCWTKATDRAGIIAFDALFGVSSGAYAASFNPATATFAPHPNESGLYLGMAFFTTSFFWLAGTPVTAALIRGKTDYLKASMFCGSVVAAGSALIFTSRWMRVKRGASPWI